MDLFFYNTLTKRKDLFVPHSSDAIGMYVCGPTVYDRAHLGNARAVVVFDSLFRLLRARFGNRSITYVRNITDVDDKINTAAREQRCSIQEITARTTQQFHDDMRALLCLSPTHEPRATEHIDEMIAMIETLIARNHAYAAEGHVLFSVKSDPNYGHLSRRSRDEMIAGARVEVAPFKRDAEDFVLWKPSASDEPAWHSPWGMGRPGWHIECSAMSTRYLGASFDLHGGGADLQFPHHENEIAQSVCAHPESHFARMWLHNGFLTVNGEKMSKSLGNFITPQDLFTRGVPGEVIRHALLATHYRKPLDWNDKALHDASLSVAHYYRALLEASPLPEHSESLSLSDIDPICAESLADDLNTPKFLARLHELAREVQKATGEEKIAQAKRLRSSGACLGFACATPSAFLDGGEAPAEILQLAEQNAKARLEKNWPEADRTRAAAKALGYVLENKPDGKTVWRKE